MSDLRRVKCLKAYDYVLVIHIMSHVQIFSKANKFDPTQKSDQYYIINLVFLRIKWIEK